MHGKVRQATSSVTNYARHVGEYVVKIGKNGERERVPVVEETNEVVFFACVDGVPEACMPRSHWAFYRLPMGCAPDFGGRLIGVTNPETLAQRFA